MRNPSLRFSWVTYVVIVACKIHYILQHFFTLVLSGVGMDVSALNKIFAEEEAATAGMEPQTLG